jgi:hypothetical protein
MRLRFQFSLRALLVAMLVVAAFFGGIRFERERRRREDETARLEADKIRQATVLYYFTGDIGDQLLTLPSSQAPRP